MLIKLLDLGSNSFQVQRLRVTTSGVETLDKAKHFFRLGARLGLAGEFSEAVLTEAALVVARLMQQVPGSGEPWGIATAAVRRAPNGGSLLRRLEESLGIPVFLLAPDEEAELAYRGALTELGPRGGSATLVVDIGGGSTELAWGDAQGSVVQLSLPLGTLELQRAGRGVDQAMRKRLQSELGRLGDRPIQHVVFASGAPRAVFKVGERLGILESTSLGSEPEQLRRLAARVQELSDLELLTAGCPRERVQAIRPAASLMSAVVELSGAPRWQVVSSGVREGAAQVLGQLCELGAGLPDQRPWASGARLLQRVDERLQPNWSLARGERPSGLHALSFASTGNSRGAQVWASDPR